MNFSTKLNTLIIEHKMNSDKEKDSKEKDKDIKYMMDFATKLNTLIREHKMEEADRLFSQSFLKVQKNFVKNHVRYTHYLSTLLSDWDKEKSRDRVVIMLSLFLVLFYWKESTALTFFSVQYACKLLFMVSKRCEDTYGDSYIIELYDSIESLEGTKRWIGAVDTLVVPLSKGDPNNLWLLMELCTYFYDKNKNIVKMIITMFLAANRNYYQETSSFISAEIETDAEFETRPSGVKRMAFDMIDLLSIKNMNGDEMYMSDIIDQMIGQNDREKLLKRSPQAQDRYQTNVESLHTIKV